MIHTPRVKAIYDRAIVACQAFIDAEFEAGRTPSSMDGEMMVEHGPGHIVFADGNMEDGFVHFCINEAGPDHPLTPFLKELLEIPLEEREPDFEDDEDEDPEFSSPTLAGEVQFEVARIESNAAFAKYIDGLCSMDLAIIEKHKLVVGQSFIYRTIKQTPTEDDPNTEAIEVPLRERVDGQILPLPIQDTK